MALNYINDLTVDVLTIVLVVNKVPRVSSIMRFFKKKNILHREKQMKWDFSWQVGHSQVETKISDKINGFACK